MNLRKALPGDAEAIRDLINLAFRVERFFVESDRISLEEVRARLETGEFIVADAAGCVYLEPRGQRAYLGLLAVDPDRQGQGLGKQLVEAAEQRCRDLGCRFADMKIVNLRQDLPGFYRSLGYVESGTEPFPSDVPTRLPCYFIKMSKVLPPPRAADS